MTYLNNEWKHEGWYKQKVLGIDLEIRLLRTRVSASINNDAFCDVLFIFYVWNRCTSPVSYLCYKSPINKFRTNTKIYLDMLRHGVWYSEGKSSVI